MDKGGSRWTWRRSRGYSEEGWNQEVTRAKAGEEYYWAHTLEQSREFDMFYHFKNSCILTHNSMSIPQQFCVLLCIRIPLELYKIYPNQVTSAPGLYHTRVLSIAASKP